VRAVCPVILVLPAILAPKAILGRKATPGPRVILVSVSLLVARRVRC
jgi:hypothetical protein